MKTDAPELSTCRALRVQGGEARELEERLARESPLEIRLNRRSHTLLMVNPAHLEELARGFCLSEGLVASPEQVEAVEVGSAELEGVGPAYWAEVSLPAELARAARVRRVAPAATSCGLCGLESLNQLGDKVEPVSDAGWRTDIASLLGLAQEMTRQQPLYSQTGGTHAVLLARPGGEVVTVREDVGRHNALDKAIGAALAAGEDLGGLLAILSGRVSYEMALKAARAGLGLVASVSAPTALGQALCQRLGVTLVGFVREGRATVFSHARRVRLQPSPMANPE